MNVFPLWQPLAKHQRNGMQIVGKAPLGGVRLAEADIVPRYVAQRLVLKPYGSGCVVHGKGQQRLARRLPPKGMVDRGYRCGNMRRRETGSRALDTAPCGIDRKQPRAVRAIASATPKVRKVRLACRTRARP